MALSANKHYDSFPDQTIRTLPVKGSTHPYKGSLIGVSAGYARPLVAGDVFAGLAYEEVNNTGADGAKTVRVYTEIDIEVSVTNAAVTDIGRPVFASDDSTFTFAGEGNSYLGVVREFVSSGKVILRIDPLRRMVKTITHAVENLGAGADIAARGIYAFCQQGWIICAHIVNQSTSAAGIDAGNTCVVALANTAGAIASKTFNNAVTFPAANAQTGMGAITNPSCPAGDVLTVAVTNGATADPGPFTVEVCYV